MKVRRILLYAFIGLMMALAVAGAIHILHQDALAIVTYSIQLDGPNPQGKHVQFVFGLETIDRWTGLQNGLATYDRFDWFPNTWQAVLVEGQGIEPNFELSDWVNDVPATINTCTIHVVAE